MNVPPEPEVKVLRTLSASVLAGQAALVGPLVFGLFCLVALWIWLPTSDRQAPDQDSAQKDLSILLAEGRAEIEALIPITADRPLFQAARRPLAAPDAPAPPPEATLVLVGILGDGDERIALVRSSNSPQLFQIAPGGRLGKWEILTLGVSSIDVREDDGTTFTLRLDG